VACSQVFSIRHLPKMDTFGACDGYVAVEVKANGQPMTGGLQKSEMIKVSLCLCAKRARGRAGDVAVGSCDAAQDL
jgi:hypothetical protein